MTALAKTATNAEAIEKVLMAGDLSALNPDQRLSYYKQTCESLGLNPLTKPFEYIKLNGKLTLYARKDATDQLRKINHVSIEKPDIQQIDNLIIVTVSARCSDGRVDSDIGVVPKSDMNGNLSNALMKAVTKAKRRVTLSICGLGMLDETEVETIPNAEHPKFPTKGELVKQPQPTVLDEVELGVGSEFTEAVLDACSPTPEQQFEAKQGEVTELLKQLNASGDSIEWKRSTLNDYVNNLFEVEDGTDSLSLPSYDALIADLQERLASLKA